MENFIPTSQGPAHFRNGTAYIAPARITTGNCPLLVPFKGTNGTSYMLEFSDQQLRIFNDDGLVTADPLTVTDAQVVAPIKPGFDTIELTVGTSHGILAGYFVEVQGIVSVFDENGLKQVLSVTSTTIKYAGVNPLGAGTISSFAGATVQKQVTVGTSYTETQFRDIQFAQANDVMYIVHPSHAPRKLTRTNDTTWTFGTYSRTSDPFGSTNSYPSTVCFHQQALIMAGTNSNPLKFWKSVPGSFDDFSTGTAADDALTYTFASDTFAAIRSVKSVDGALIFTCSDKNRRVTGNFTPTTPPTIQDIDTDGAGGVIPAANDRALISVSKDLRRVKSISYEYNAGGAVATEITKAADHLTISGVSQLCFQSFINNSNWIMKADGSLIGLNQDIQEQVMGWYRFTTRQGDLIQSIAARPIDGGFDELWMIVERTIAADRVRYIEKMVLESDCLEREDFYSGDETQDEIDFDNYMFEQQKQRVHLDCSLTYDGSEQGTTTLSLTALSGALVTATASSNTFEASDVGREIWAKEGEGRLLIETYISATKVSGRTIKDFGTVSFDVGEWYLTAVEITGLAHLEGQNVCAVADGAPYYELTVVDGAITLPKQASVVHVGLKFTGWIKSQDLQGDGITGKKKNLNKATIYFYNSLGASVGTSRYRMEKIPFRNTKSKMGRAPALYTGYREVPFDDATSEEKSVYIKQDTPCPCVVQMIQPHFTVGEG